MNPLDVLDNVRAFYDRLADTDVDELADLDVCALVEDLGRILEGR